MANTKRKLPVWAIILYSFTALILLAGVGIMIFGFINSATILPYKRQNILEYFSDEASYYTVSGTVEDVSLGEAENGAYPLEVTLKDVTSEEEGINERGIVTFTLPQETYFLLSGNGFFTALAEGAEAEFLYGVERVGKCGDRRVHRGLRKRHVLFRGGGEPRVSFGLGAERPRMSGRSALLGGRRRKAPFPRQTAPKLVDKRPSGG